MRETNSDVRRIHIVFLYEWRIFHLVLQIASQLQFMPGKTQCAQDQNKAKDPFPKEDLRRAFPALSHQIENQADRTHEQCGDYASEYALHNETVTGSLQRRLQLKDQFIHAKSRPCRKDPIGKKDQDPSRKDQGACREQRTCILLRSSSYHSFHIYSGLTIISHIKQL